MTASLDALVEALGGKREGHSYRCRCPVHNGRSLIVTDKNGKILLNCKQGCEQSEVIKALEGLGLWGDAEDAEPAPSRPQHGEVLEAQYQYRDMEGKVAAIHGRFRPKNFRWRLPGSDEWTGLKGLKESTLALWGAQDLPPDGPVFLCEGEKAAKACRAVGLAATCGCGGAGQRDFGKALSVLAGRDVVLWPDNDEPGRKLMRHLARLLVGSAKSLRVAAVDVPPAGDAFEYFGQGGSVDGLMASLAEPSTDTALEGRMVLLPGAGLPLFTVDDAGVHWVRRMEAGFTLGLDAANIRQASTGVHAMIAISVDGQRVAYDTFNIGRHGDRVRLANEAHGRIGKELIDKAGLAYILDDFCGEVWTRWSARFAPELLTPSIDNMKPTEYALDPYVVIGGGTIMFAAPGLGKSYIAMLLCQSIHCGCDRFWKVSRHRPLYVNLERSRQSLERRLMLVNEALGLEPETPMPMLNARGRTLSSVMDSITEPPEVLFVDSLSRFGIGSLTKDEDVNPAMDKLNALSETWFLIAHAPRTSTQHAYGSVMQDAAADLMIQVNAQHKDDGTLGIGLQGTKANDMPMPKLAIWAMEFDQYGLSAFREARPGEFPDVEAGKKQGMAEQVYWHLLNAGDMDVSSIAKDLGLDRQTVNALLNSDSRFTRTGKDARKVLYGVFQDR